MILLNRIIINIINIISIILINIINKILSSSKKYIQCFIYNIILEIV